MVFHNLVVEVQDKQDLVTVSNKELLSVMVLGLVNHKGNY